MDGGGPRHSLPMGIFLVFLGLWMEAGLGIAVALDDENYTEASVGAGRDIGFSMPRHYLHKFWQNRSFAFLGTRAATLPLFNATKCPSQFLAESSDFDFTCLHQFFLTIFTALFFYIKS